MSATIRTACGVVLIVAGLVGMLLPILPGIPLIVAGAAMLGSDHPLVRIGRNWLERRGLWRKERKPNELPNVQG